MAHSLFQKKLGGWDLSKLPEPLNSLPLRSTNTETFSHYHNEQRAYATINSHIVKAICERVKGEESSIGVNKIGEGNYACEYTDENGDIYIYHLRSNGMLSGCVINGSTRNIPIKTLGSEVFDTSPIMLLAFMQMCEKDLACREKFAQFANDTTNDDDREQYYYYFSDALYYAISNMDIKVTVPGGNIEFLSEATLKMGALEGEVICGSTPHLTSIVEVKLDKLSLGEAKKEFQEIRKSRRWSDSEEKLIPVFDDSFPVPKEVLKIARLYVATKESKIPMKNFLWRGISAYGKSTGVEILASMLKMPLLRMTCHSNMETQNFLSDFVPAESFTVKELPSFSEIACDPESAYFKLTGLEREDATADECLLAYGEAVKSSASDKQLFKHIESNFIKALEKGYILEIQEISRIKDPGVLVGLNEYDRPGARIPLVNGEFVKRHEDSIIVYTDNVGYASCRALDPSVIRRMSIIIDSHNMPKEDALVRVRYNTEFDDEELLDKMYDLWEKIDLHCKDRDIVDGCISLAELERWCQVVKLNNYSNIKESFRDCVVAKATSLQEEQEELMTIIDLVM